MLRSSPLPARHRPHPGQVDANRQNAKQAACRMVLERGAIAPKGEFRNRLGLSVWCWEVRDGRVSECYIPSRIIQDLKRLRSIPGSVPAVSRLGHSEPESVGSRLCGSSEFDPPTHSGCRDSESRALQRESTLRKAVRLPRVRAGLHQCLMGDRRVVRG